MKCDICGDTKMGLLPVEQGLVEIHTDYFCRRSQRKTLCTRCNMQLRTVIRDAFAIVEAYLAGPKVWAGVPVLPAVEPTRDVIGDTLRSVMDGVSERMK